LINDKNILIKEISYVIMAINNKWKITNEVVL